MKRPILKRTVKTIEVVTWTLEYEDVAETSPPPPPASSPPHPPKESPPSQEISSPQPILTTNSEKHESAQASP